MTDDLEPALRAVLSAVPGWSRLDPRVTPITLGITNRNFRVDIQGASYVVRLPGRDTELLGIDRACEYEAARAAAAAGVAPEVVGYLPEHGALITRFVEAGRLAPEDLERPELMRRVVDAILAIHAIPGISSRFDPFEIVPTYRATAEARGVRVPAAYDRALDATGRIRAAFASHPMPERTCHNDLLNANFLIVNGRVLVVDYEYAGVGDPFFDLGNLAVNNGISPAAERVLLDCYFGRVTPAAIARLALMRIVSDFREAMWGVVQQALSTLEVDYVGYADRHFARCLSSVERPEFDRWLQDARGSVT